MADPMLDCSELMTQQHLSWSKFRLSLDGDSLVRQSRLKHTHFLIQQVQVNCFLEMESLRKTSGSDTRLGTDTPAADPASQPTTNTPNTPLPLPSLIEWQPLLKSAMEASDLSRRGGECFLLPSNIYRYLVSENRDNAFPCYQTVISQSYTFSRRGCTDGWPAFLGCLNGEHYVRMLLVVKLIAALIRGT